MKIKLVTVTPVYKTSLNEFEIKALCQLLQLTPELNHVLVAPNSLDLTFYQTQFGNAFEIQRFDDSFFKSPQTYNNLLRSLIFFTRFSTYSHLVMYHTDAWIFENKLLEWAQKDFSYIGAPIYEYDGSIEGRDFVCSGQGGFSMHHISSAIEVLNSTVTVYPLLDLKQWYRQYNWKGRLRFAAYFITSYLGKNRSSKSGNNNLKVNEDIWWGKYVANAFSWYKVPSESEAAKFSMEFNCEALLNNNKGQLPMGTHQWFKPPFKAFWSKHITV